MMNNNFDIAICGAGPVGMALAALLVQHGVASARIGLIDGKTLAEASLDPRSIALSWGSRQILEKIDAWPLEVTAIEQIHVSRKGRFGRSLIDCRDHATPALGYVARYGALVSRLGAVCLDLGLQTLRPARVLACTEETDGCVLEIDDGAARQLHAALVVQAEGGLFGAQASRSRQHDYQQTALIAQVKVSAPIARRAFERFTDEGPLALLPQGDAYSLVWCVRPATAQALLALSDGAFLEQLGQAFGARLGRFTSTSPRLSFQLGLNADTGKGAGKRSVAIGNAAQTMHPVAGQGLNLGLRDALVLARTLASDAKADSEAGPALLAQFIQARQPDRRLTLRLTDSMARIFANDTPLQGLLGLSLGLIDTINPARTMLAEQMMYGRR